jgi:hypothetical protein
MERSRSWLKRVHSSFIQAEGAIESSGCALEKCQRSMSIALFLMRKESLAGHTKEDLHLY